ncbi:MAG: elongation factor P [Myxococcales bacterium]|nr:elongation factor P [Myxococcales bacterium]
MPYSTAEFRKGLKIEISDEPYVIVDFQHVKPGKGGAFVRTKLKSLLNGAVVDKTFRSGEKVGEPALEQKNAQYLYGDGEMYHFMDNESYEQFGLTPEVLGDAVHYLKENTEIQVLFFRGKAINVDVPTFIELRVTQTEPGVRGDTATNVTKPATLETGYVVNVPLFINEDDVIKIDTRDGSYASKVTG